MRNVAKGGVRLMKGKKMKKDAKGEESMRKKKIGRVRWR